MSNRETILRICTLCDQSYPAGTYRAHAAVHVPVRVRAKRVNGEVSTTWTRVEELLGEGLPQAEVARRLGVSRQRVHQIAHFDAATGQRYDRKKGAAA